MHGIKEKRIRADVGSSTHTHKKKGLCLVACVKAHSQRGKHVYVYVLEHGRRHMAVQRRGGLTDAKE